MKIVRLISRIIVGLVFIFSGIVKAIDPLGSGYKFHDYFQAFHIDFLQFLALPLGILLCTAEFISGFAVLTGYRFKAGIWGVMIMMLIFTPLTLVLALTNPVSDCGCFGDAIHLTNWQTFGKNIVILLFALVVFFGRKGFRSRLKPSAEWIIAGSVTLLFILFSLSNLRYLPVVDFLPYKTGTNIPEMMKIPENMPPDLYETTFIYEKEGIQKEFSLENYPADDTTWVFIDQKSILVKKGYQPPIHDFSIVSPENGDLTDMILSDDGYTLLMISSKIEEADSRHLGEAFQTGYFCQENGIDFHIVTASGTDEIKNFDNGLSFCSADEITLKTIVRANPGYILLREGNIIGKWSWATVPDKEWFSGDISAKQAGRLNNRNSIMNVIILVLSLTLITLLISSALSRYRNKDNNTPL